MSFSALGLFFTSIITCFRENTLKLVHFRVFGNLGQIMESIGIYWNFISRFVGETAWNQNITPQWLDALWLMANTYQHEPPWLDRAPSLLGCTLGRLDWAKKPRVESIRAIGCNAIRSSSKCRRIRCQVEVRLVWSCMFFRIQYRRHTQIFKKALTMRWT